MAPACRSSTAWPSPARRRRGRSWPAGWEVVGGRRPADRRRRRAGRRAGRRPARGAGAGRAGRARRAASTLVVPSPGVPEAPSGRSRPPRPRACRCAARSTSPTSGSSSAPGGPRPMLAVTGTDGKTTTTLLATAWSRRRAGGRWPPGNTEVPLVSALDLDVDVFVVECTSFRLAWTDVFRPAAGTWLNLAEDHLDWHALAWTPTPRPRPASGRTSRRRRGHRLRRRPGVMAWLRSAPGRHVTFGRRRGRLPRGRRPPGRTAGRLADRRPSPTSGGSCRTTSPTRWPPRPPCSRRGVATVDGRRRGRWPRFEGLPHRIALVADAGGVSFYDDSKATTPHAALAAIRAFEHVVLVAGGRNKGLDLRADGRRAGRACAPSSPSARPRAEVAAAFAGVCPVVDRPASMDDAVAAARAAGRRPATWCCCRRAAPASTGTRATPSGATTSPGPSASWSDGGADVSASTTTVRGGERGRRRPRRRAAPRHAIPPPDAGPTRAPPGRPAAARRSTTTCSSPSSPSSTLLGLVMVLSASSVTALLVDGSSWTYFRRQALWMVLGAVALLVTAGCPTTPGGRFVPGAARRRVRCRWSLVLVPGIGDGERGQGVVHVRPVRLPAGRDHEAGAAALHRRPAGPAGRPDARGAGHAACRCWWCSARPCGLALLQPDLGGAMVLASIVLGVAFVAGTPLLPLAGTARRRSAWLGAGVHAAGPLRPLDGVPRPGRSTSRTPASRCGSRWSASRRAASPASASAPARRSGASCPRPTPTSSSPSSPRSSASPAWPSCCVPLPRPRPGSACGSPLRAPDRFGMLLAGGITAWILVPGPHQHRRRRRLMPLTGLTLPFVSFGGSSLLVIDGGGRPAAERRPRQPVSARPCHEGRPTCRCSSSPAAAPPGTCCPGWPSPRRS